MLNRYGVVYTIRSYAVRLTAALFLSVVVALFGSSISLDQTSKVSAEPQQRLVKP